MASISKRNIERIGRATQRTERAYQNPTLDVFQRQRWSPVTRIAKTDGSGMTALSGTTPGYGNVVLYSFDRDAGTLTSRDTIKAYNSMPSAIPANLWIKVSRIDGAWFITNQQCTGT